MQLKKGQKISKSSFHKVNSAESEQKIDPEPEVY